MESRGTYLIRLIYLLVDAFLVNAWYFSAARLRYGSEALEVLQLNYYEQLLVVLNLAWLMLEFAQRFYTFERTEKFSQTFKRLIKVSFWFFLLLTTYIFTFKEYDFSRLFMAYYFSGLFVLLAIWRWSAFQMVKLYRRKGGNHRYLILVGSNSHKKDFTKQIVENRDYGFEIAAEFKSWEEAQTEGLQHLINEEKGDELIGFVSEKGNEATELIRMADKYGIRVRLVPDFSFLGARQVQLDFTERIPVLTPRSEPLSLWHNQLLKRLIDLVFSLFLMLLVFPWLFPVLAVLVKLSSKGPVFFIQKRSGASNQVIQCVKFRTMVSGHHVPERQATENDHRTTKIGRWLRRTSLDELPQFFNVLKGEMSIVGPRPHMLVHTEKYAQMIDSFMVRHSIKPGITGLAQVRGYRGEIKSEKDLKQRVFFDVVYLENWNVFLDMKIMFQTLIKILFGDKNAY